MTSQRLLELSPLSESCTLQPVLLLDMGDNSNRLFRVVFRSFGLILVKHTPLFPQQLPRFEDSSAF